MSRSTRGAVVIVFSVLFFSLAFLAGPQKVNAISGSDWRPGNIIDDSIFYDNSSMGAQDIQNFLNSKMPSCDTNGSRSYNGGSQTRAQYAAANGKPLPPYICLKDYTQDGLSAAQIIKNAGDTYNVSPKTLIVLLQKEQTLVTDDWPWPNQYRSATGYGCPDTAACDSQYYGFYNQVTNAARQFRLYANNPNNYRYKPYQSNYIQYNPNAACGGTNVVIENKATAGLYNYTPYQPNVSALNNLYGSGDGCGAYGNRNFWRLFNDWFGGSRDGRCSYDPIGSSITGITFRKYDSRMDQANLVIYSGSSTNCIESHTWNVGVTSWASHIASNHPVASPDRANVQYADLNGDGIDEPILIGMNNTGSGRTEFHIWNRNMNSWSDHIISEATTGLTNGKIVFADTDGDGRDEAVFILYSGTGSGKVEFHVMNNDLRTWKWHVATQLSPLDPAVGTINFADLDGNRVDEAVLTLYKNTGSGRVEFHTWNPGWASWRFNTASNLPEINPIDGFITFADVDGSGVDEAVLLGLRNTGSGRVEFHTWNPGVSSWRYHTASNQASL